MLQHKGGLVVLMWCGWLVRETHIETDATLDKGAILKGDASFESDNFNMKEEIPTSIFHIVLCVLSMLSASISCGLSHFEQKLSLRPCVRETDDNQSNSELEISCFLACLQQIKPNF